jgi:predicted component of type VI protein secretion system
VLLSPLDSLIKYAPRYELGAALKILQEAGYGWSEFRFEGIQELYPKRGPLLRAIRIETTPAKLAVLSLNTGLLSAGSPLPGYFMEFARKLPNPDPFVKFLGFWDALNLSSSAYAAWPELSAGRKGLLGKTYRARLRFDSPVTLHWLFHSIFPELQVRVQNTTFRRRGRGARARVGRILDGRLVIGEEFPERCSGFRVILRAETVTSEIGFDWESEAEARLERIAHVLAQAKSPVEVVLSFEQYPYGQRLVGDSNARRQLGVRPWVAAVPEIESGPGEVILRRAFQ